MPTHTSSYRHHCKTQSLTLPTVPRFPGIEILHVHVPRRNHPTTIDGLNYPIRIDNNDIPPYPRVRGFFLFTMSLLLELWLHDSTV